jgi:hypothetical protein
MVSTVSGWEGVDITQAVPLSSQVSSGVGVAGTVGSAEAHRLVSETATAQREAPTASAANSWAATSVSAETSSHRLGSWRVDPSATFAAAPDGQQRFGLQDPDRFAQHGPRHAVPGEELCLIGQKIAVAELAEDDLAADVVGHKLARGGVRYGLTIGIHPTIVASK